MAELLEKEIERRVGDYLVKLGGKSYKFTSPAHRAVPDRVMVFPNGYVVFVEFKRTGARPVRTQWREIEALRQRGQLVCVIDNVEDGKAMVDEIIRRPPLNLLMTLQTQPEQ